MRAVLVLAMVATVALPMAAIGQAHSRHMKRQAHAAHHAPAAGEFGTVHFAISCNAAVATRFDHAVAQLHSFEFGASIKGFNEVLAGDSTCAMAHWGLALSRWGNPMSAGNRSVTQLAQGRVAATAAMRVGASTSERERAWIQAVARLYDDYENQGQRARVVAYEQAMRDVVRRFPADTEARIFHAIALTASAPPTDKTYASQLEAGRELERLWRKQPNHPGLAHYIIHTYDVPPLASRARVAAQRYSGIAPSAAHALHMPSHTFTRVGDWDASVQANIRSIKAAIANGAVGEALHASDYAVYAYLQMGKDADAREIVNALPELAARYDGKAVLGAAPPSAAYFVLAAIPARFVLERRAWAEASALKATSTPYPYAEAMTQFARAVGNAHLHDVPATRTAIDSLASYEKWLTTSGESYWAEQVAIQRVAAEGWLAFAEHRNEDAVARLTEATTREDATEKSAITPGPLAPAREQLADLYAELARTAEARDAYRAVLRKEPKRRHAMMGLSGKQRLAEVSSARDVIFVWAGDSAGKGSDFMAVIDATPTSPSYGSVVSSTATGVAGSHPHHTEATLASNGHLLANGFRAGRTWLFDVSGRGVPKLLTSFGDVGGFSHPHTFVRLANGNVLTTFQYKADPSAAAPTHSHGTAAATRTGTAHATGGLVEMSERGKLVRSGAASDANIEDRQIFPYAVLPIAAIDRAVSTTTDMDEGNTKATSQWVQLWRLSDLTLLRTVALPPGPRGDENQYSGEPLLLADGKSVYVHTFNCGLYLLRGVERDQPSATFVKGFEGKNCGVPVLAGHYWLQTVPESHALVSLDVSDPEHPRQVSSVAISDEQPHWISMDRTGRRIVLNSGGGGANRVYIINLDPMTGVLSMDERFHDAGASRSGVSFSARAWPHGWTGTAIPHGAVFSR